MTETTSGAGWVLRYCDPDDAEGLETTFAYGADMLGKWALEDPTGEWHSTIDGPPPGSTRAVRELASQEVARVAGCKRHSVEWKRIIPGGPWEFESYYYV